MSGVWLAGIQRMVHILQELEEDGPVDYSVRCKIVVPRGTLLSLGVFPCSANRFLQLMAMNVVPRLVLDDA